MRDENGLLPAVNEALGELAFESGRLEEARRFLARALPDDSDLFVDQAEADAQAHLGLVEATRGRPGEGRTLLERSLERAKRMGRVAVQARYAMFLARSHLLEGNAAAARRVFEESVPERRDQLPSELRAQVAYWNARAEGEEAARSRGIVAARKLIQDLANELPESDRRQFLGRPEIRVVLAGA